VENRSGHAMPALTPVIAVSQRFPPDIAELYLRTFVGFYPM
jgi:hypothetical protein